MNRHQRRASGVVPTKMITDPGRPSGHCHKLIAATAKSMAQELYEVVMGDNELFSTWKTTCAARGISTPEGREIAFVARNWGQCVPRARATLAGLLAGPLEESLKDEIFEALLLDNTLRVPRAMQQPQPTRITRIDD